MKETEGICRKRMARCRMAFAGMDVGTSGCKLLVYDLDGNVIFKAVRHYAEEGGAGRRELNPELVLQKVKVLRETGDNCRNRWKLWQLQVLENLSYAWMRRIGYWQIPCSQEIPGAYLRQRKSLNG